LDRPTVEALIATKRLGDESRHGQKGDDAAGRLTLAKGTVLHLPMTVSAIPQSGALRAAARLQAFSESVDRKAEQPVVKVIRRRMQRVLQLAGLPPHHTPHSHRHSFASILISKGCPIARPAGARPR
jgi:integrase